MIQFGDSQKLRLVRILRSTVMVRVGGGWVALDEFLVKNDPCRGELDILKLSLRLNEKIFHYNNFINDQVKNVLKDAKDKSITFFNPFKKPK